LASAFEIFLRSGRRVAEPPETKFNPWHDPEDGRFTFAGQGRNFPGSARSQANGQNRTFGGRRGSFGGGGASGSWEPSSPPRPTATRGRGGSAGGGGASGSWTQQPVQRPDAAPKSTQATTIAQTPPQQRSAHEPRLTVPRNGYDFSIDAHARTRRISGELRLQPQPRSRSAQRDASKPDRRITDDGGHFIAARFNGPGEWFNHFAQDANFNRGAYRALEDKWAGAVRSGKRVFVDIVPHYRGTSMRPNKLIVRWVIDGEEFIREFPNEKQRRRHGN
jgi:hypothetical protein